MRTSKESEAEPTESTAEAVSPAGAEAASQTSRTSPSETGAETGEPGAAVPTVSPFLRSVPAESEAVADFPSPIQETATEPEYDCHETAYQTSAKENWEGIPGFSGSGSGVSGFPDSGGSEVGTDPSEPSETASPVSGSRMRPDTAPEADCSGVGGGKFPSTTTVPSLAVQAPWEYETVTETPAPTGLTCSAYASAKPASEAAEAAGTADGAEERRKESGFSRRDFQSGSPAV